jgi:hypothetical protein
MLENDLARRRGTRTVCGRKRHGETGFFVEPTDAGGERELRDIARLDLLTPGADD